MNLIGRIGYNYTEEISDGSNGETLFINPIRNITGSVTCTLICGSNTGKVQFTTSSTDDISAETETWQDWPFGTITGTFTDSLLNPVTAIRGVSVSGDIKLEVVL
jgi:hypothetical protein